LLLDVLHDHFISHVARTGCKISASPYVPTPKRPTQALIFHQHLSRRLPLYGLSQLADRYVWGNRHKYVHVILRDMSLENLHVVRLTYLPDQLSNSLGNLPPQNRLAVFRDPYKVILQIINGMARFTVVLHTASILKSSPKGEGFSPNPRRRQ
jgi:hypothetical protein